MSESARAAQAVPTSNASPSVPVPPPDSTSSVDREAQSAPEVASIESIKVGELVPQTGPVTTPIASLEPRAATGQPILPGTGFPATGPNLAVAPDPTFGASDGFTHEYNRRYDQYRNTYNVQLGRAQQLQVRVREVVERFLTLVGKDEQLRQVFSSDDLSDEQRAAFRGRIETLERTLGLTWGGEPDKTPQGETNLNSRVITSGMMI